MARETSPSSRFVKSESDVCSSTSIEWRKKAMNAAVEEAKKKKIYGGSDGSSRCARLLLNDNFGHSSQVNS